MKINYHHRQFRSVTNSASGQVNADTLFAYSQQGNQLRATYQGGEIAFGQMLGIVHEDSSLDFVYHHIDRDGNLKSGHCRSIPELLPGGRVRLHETWYWDYGSGGNGVSVVEEISEYSTIE